MYGSSPTRLTILRLCYVVCAREMFLLQVNGQRVALLLMVESGSWDESPAMTG